MNLHYLELFYYVAKFGGVAAAERNIPWGVKSSALSAQMLAFEDDLGGKLFERRPFALTEAGQELYAFARLVVEGAPIAENKVQEKFGRRLRVGASEIVLRDYLPSICGEMRAKFPGLKINLRIGQQPELEEMLRRRDINVALTLLDTVEETTPRQNKNNPSSLSSPHPKERRDGEDGNGDGDGFCLQKLFQFPLALLVPEQSKIKSAEQFLKQLVGQTGGNNKAAKGGRPAGKNELPDERIYCLPESHAITRQFVSALKALNIDDLAMEELGTVELIEAYVRNGSGIGVALHFKRLEKLKGVRVLPLKNFAPVTFGLMWQGELNEVMTAFIELVRAKKI
jgi:DNA-binding transcriptional LysR family regulator